MKKNGGKIVQFILAGILSIGLSFGIVLTLDHETVFAKKLIDSEESEGMDSMEAMEEMEQLEELMENIQEGLDQENKTQIKLSNQKETNETIAEIITIENEVAQTTQWSITLVPLNPAPFQDVICTVNTSVSGIAIQYRVVGTDGYVDSGSLVSGGNGQASFSILGGPAGVSSTVTITIAEWGSTKVATISW